MGTRGRWVSGPEGRRPCRTRGQGTEGGHRRGPLPLRPSEGLRVPVTRQLLRELPSGLIIALRPQVGRPTPAGSAAALVSGFP